MQDTDDPSQIDWPARQQVAAIPFKVHNGRPVNPCERTGRTGRDQLWHWGEGQAADAVVTAHLAGHRWLLMVERGDGLGWALPGGMIDPGEDPLSAAIRELAEETGLAVGGIAAWQTLGARYVSDPRATDEAWMVTTPALADLGEVADHPRVRGADDAARAAWIKADTYLALEADVAEYGGQVFAAHAAMLRELLSGIPASEGEIVADHTTASWYTKTAAEMTDDEVNEARAYYDSIGSNSMEGEWLRRHGLPENYGD
ncbi:ADP-ribose pyrophosphatase YjhB, NUDIX family [Sinosporangium album]|uniref:ADP-ribose pyrophosphatase YjhB, NUDIX family n=1 Tax=Sinosporangium album TaxID=504805 RepID=A0A1G8L7G8_9ACTN|nr:NUDIX domain-containing protein [Sinosporangium album]SDI51598.1 ADP-ribose pyrophosphatase YjhB, NUDIX family [Sinosporangium album]